MRTIQWYVDNKVWLSANGKETAITAMKGEHLEKAIKKAEKSTSRLHKKLLPILIAEEARRDDLAKTALVGLGINNNNKYKVRVEWTVVQSAFTYIEVEAQDKAEARIIASTESENIDPTKDGFDGESSYSLDNTHSDWDVEEIEDV